ncbi:efflux transporter periplasmic adaptor subunit, partial [Pseudomonas aeruginosa]
LNTELPGRTNAFRIAEVRPQVNGIILKRLFKEGSDVKAGQQLVVRVGEYRADSDRAGAFVDGNLGELETAFQRVLATVF